MIRREPARTTNEASSMAALAWLQGIGLEEYAQWFHDAELREEADLIALAAIGTQVCASTTLYPLVFFTTAVENEAGIFFMTPIDPFNLQPTWRER
jgi:hypothetical protein